MIAVLALDQVVAFDLAIPAQVFGHPDERNDLPVEDVAARCGFGTATTLREHFARAVRSTPTAYRRAFRA